MEKPKERTSLEDDLKRHIQGLKEENRLKLYYLLDYVLNYKKGWRFLHKISELNLWNELSTLTQLGIVQKEEERDYRGNRYEVLFIKEENKNFIRRILKEQYFPIFADEEKIRRLLFRFVDDNFKVAVKIYQDLRSFVDAVAVTLTPNYEAEPIQFGKLLSEGGFGYYVGYKSASWQTYSDEFVFREEPVDLKIIFLEIVEKELRKRLARLSPVEKWCVFLRYVKDDARDEFFINNRTVFTPQEIRGALKKVPDLRSRQLSEAFDSILLELRDKMSRRMRSFFLRDVNYLTTMSLLILLGEEQKRFLSFSDSQMSKIKEVSYSQFDTVQQYVEDLVREGFVLKDNYAYLIPNMIKEAFVNETRGNILEVKIFSDRLDAENFICDLIGKAEKVVRIWDPYFSRQTFDLINMGISPSSSVTVEVLTSCPSGYASIDDKGLRHHLSLLKKKGVKVKVKAIFKTRERGCESPFHDRYVILDNKEVWSFGSSLHSIGEKGEMALQLKTDVGDIILNAFENYWNKKELNDWKIKEKEALKKR